MTENRPSCEAQTGSAKSAVVAQIARLVRRAGLDYEGWRHVAKRVRKLCDLTPARKGKKLPRVLTADDFRRTTTVGGMRAVMTNWSFISSGGQSRPKATSSSDRVGGGAFARGRCPASTGWPPRRAPAGSRSSATCGCSGAGYRSPLAAPADWYRDLPRQVRGRRLGPWRDRWYPRVIKRKTFNRGKSGPNTSTSPAD